jgi:hypothetical protein
MKRSKIKIIAEDELKSFKTKKLLSRLKALQKCENSYFSSDLTSSGIINPDEVEAEFINFKDTEKWQIAYNELTALQPGGRGQGPAIHGLAGQDQQIFFQSVEVKAHALLQPLAVDYAAAVFFGPLEVLQIKHQRHHRRDHQQQHAQQQPQRTPAAQALAGQRLLQQGKVK